MVSGGESKFWFGLILDGGAGGCVSECGYGWWAVVGGWWLVWD